MARLRPVLHFTPERGWMNDPHGVVWARGEYHLFYQANPATTQWAQPIEWAHAVSADLVSWRDLGTSLAPEPGEEGCWSGSVVIDDDGSPQLFYTRPKPGDWQHGQVVGASGSADLHEWLRWPGVPVVDGPATTGLPLFDFRDPQVRREGDGWRMVVGAGLRGVGGAAVQYRSRDLRDWQFDTLLCSRESGGELDMGTVWECPQFLEVDGRWVLLFSAMDGQRLTRASYALGDYDGQVFTPTHWGVLEPTGTAYATTTFRDDLGRPCMMSWLKETSEGVGEDSGWASAQSVVAVLQVSAGKLTAVPHPNLNRHLPAYADFEGKLKSEVGRAFVLDVSLGSTSGLDLVVAGERPWRLRFDPELGELRVEDKSGAVRALKVDSELGDTRVIVDADICEVYAARQEGFIAFRVPSNPAARITAIAQRGRLSII